MKRRINISEKDNNKIEINTVKAGTSSVGKLINFWCD